MQQYPGDLALIAPQNNVEESGDVVLSLCGRDLKEGSVSYDPVPRR